MTKEKLLEHGVIVVSREGNRIKPCNGKVVNVDPELLVVCYHCAKPHPKSDCFYIRRWDIYYCEQCYCDLVDGKSIRKPRGVV